MYTEEECADFFNFMIQEVHMKKPNTNTQLNWYFSYMDEGKYIYDGCDPDCNISYKIPPNMLDPVFEELKKIENYDHNDLQKRMHSNDFLYGYCLAPCCCYTRGHDYWVSEYKKIMQKRKQDICRVLQTFQDGTLGVYDRNLKLILSP